LLPRIFKKRRIPVIVAIPLFGSEVSPRFDCAKEIWVVESSGGKVFSGKIVEMKDFNPLQRARLLCELKVNKIICGGIDDFSIRMLTGFGIGVFPWFTGNAQEALEKYLKEEIGRKEP
jgi:predicted Fe-Mo cluster-binding NifX family protein